MILVFIMLIGLYFAFGLGYVVFLFILCLIFAFLKTF